MEAILFLVLIYGGIWFLGWLFGKIGEWIEANNRNTRNTATEEALRESNFNMAVIDDYKKKLDEIGYKDQRSDDWYRRYYLTNGRTSYSHLLVTCPACNQGELRIRKGQYGDFLGCSKYPLCKYTKDIKMAKQELREKANDDFISMFKIAYG